jgi:prevent-host-death family protein
MLDGSTITINEARPRLTEVVEAAERGPITITKNGKPVALVVSAEEWEDLQATLEVLGNPDIQRDLTDYEQAKQAGTLTTHAHDEVIGEARERG